MKVKKTKMQENREDQTPMAENDKKTLKPISHAQ